MGNLPQSLEDFNRAVELSPGLDTYFQRATTYQSLGEHAKAIADLDQVIALFPTSPMGYLARAKSREATGDAAGARSDRETARQLEERAPGPVSSRSGTLRAFDLRTLVVSWTWNLSQVDCWRSFNTCLTSLRKIFAAAPLFLLAAAGFAQTSNIQGDVIGLDGKPVQGAQIKLDRTDIKQSFKVKTDKKGHFLYANLPTGVYNITVVVGDKEMAQATGLRPRQGDNPPVQFDLAKIAAAAAAGPAARARLLPKKKG